MKPFHTWLALVCISTLYEGGKQLLGSGGSLDNWCAAVYWPGIIMLMYRFGIIDAESK